jgi:hypothetical protein
MAYLGVYTPLVAKKVWLVTGNPFGSLCILGSLRTGNGWTMDRLVNL